MDIDGVVELRVHGVSGTPPEELLDRRLVDRVAGNGTAGFFRPTLEAESTDSVPAGSSHPSILGPRLEGYAWGGLTSGAPARAFWLLLLPFSLINVAPRLRPADPSMPSSSAARRRLWAIWFLCRLLALVLTVVLVCAFTGIGIDLIGWQCGSGTGKCEGATPGWLMNRIVDKSTPHRLAIGALVPLLALFVLWFISWRSMKKTEKTPAILDAAATDPADPPDTIEVGLQSRWMWDNEHPVRRLRAIHLQTGVAVTLGFLSAPMRMPWRAIDGCAALAVLAYGVAVLCVPSFVGHTRARHWHKISMCIWAGLGLIGVGTFLWLLFDPHAVDSRFTSCRVASGVVSCRPAGTLPRYGGTLLWLLLGEIVLVGVLIAVVGSAAKAAAVPQPLGEPGPRPGVAGRGTSVLTLMAGFLASVFTSSAYLFAASWLDAGTIKPNPQDVSRATHHFAIPEVILDAALAYFVAVVIAAILFGGFGIWAIRCLRRISTRSPLLDPARFDTDYDPTCATSPRGKDILRAMWFGRLVDIAGRVLGWLMALGAALTAGFGVMLLLEHVGVDAAARLARRASGIRSSDQLLGAAPETLHALGAYLAVWTLLLLVSVGALAFRIAATRRSVGILWDLASFWPRLAHPLAPPCYAERTVPDLATRIQWYASTGTGVVVSAHSQGTVISAATILQLRTQDARTPVPMHATLPSVGLLTFGTVLRRLYGRYFPAYFGPAVLRTVRDVLATPSDGQRWRNLWRYTDYLGGPLLSGPPPRVQPVWTAADGGDPAAGQPGPIKIDAHLRDPEFDFAPGDTVFPLPGRHSDFWKVPEFQQAVVFVAGLI